MVENNKVKALEEHGKQVDEQIQVLQQELQESKEEEKKDNGGSRLNGMSSCSANGKSDGYNQNIHRGTRYRERSKESV